MTKIQDQFFDFNTVSNTSSMKIHFTPTPSNSCVEIDGVWYQIVKSSDIIEAEGRTGKKFWCGHVVIDANYTFYTCTSSWKETKSGTSKVMWSTPYCADPKNLGKVNETTNEMQAYAEFNSMVQKEKDKRESIKPLPMLAHKYEDRKHKIKFPCAVQPKYDGMRMVTDGKSGWSRGNKEIIPDIIKHILPVETHGRILDGELVLPWFPKVNVTMSAAKKYQPGFSDKLIYIVYDILTDDVTFDFYTRNLVLENWIAACGNRNIKFAETYIVTDENELMQREEEFVKRGFEGIMVRNLDGKYEINKRSNDLQKLKRFFDEEFEIVNIIPAGGGSSADVGKFVCRASNGVLFESTATGTEEERKNFLLNKDQFIGKFAKIKYRELTEYGVPFHSNVLEIRDTLTQGF